MNHTAYLGEAVHGVLRYMAKNPLIEGKLEPHYPYIWQLRGLNSSMFSNDEQLRITECWNYIWELANQARRVWLEEPGQTGKQPDMLRRIANEWQVLEFKTTNVQSTNQKSRKQIRDMMQLLITKLPHGTVISGHRIYLNCDPAVPLDPAWTEVKLSP